MFSMLFESVFLLNGFNSRTIYVRTYCVLICTMYIHDLLDIEKRQFSTGVFFCQGAPHCENGGY